MAVAIVDMSVEMTFGSMAGRTMWAGEGLGVVLEVVTGSSLEMCVVKEE